MILTDPRGLSFVEWSDYVAQDLDPAGLTPIVSKESDWQDWASIVISFPKFSGVSAPNPLQFSDWKEWVFRFNQAVESVV